MTERLEVDGCKDWGLILDEYPRGDAARIS
jgi:hypothetical protein